ncbi:dehydrogenase [Pseudoroseomonas deserti]|uniref:Dehydrogenase n=1 Tax=Teichococcus deserti TaxID=1817963 RepID=A0A1V2H3R3_9PROT|nr:YciI family protein [Pseudoroseomonas deserti]ONG52928.1 dehydrogenase [Pseudoroseomonas deserti]
MRVMVLVKATTASEAGEMPSVASMEEMGRFNEALAAAGLLLAGEGLHPSRSGHRIRFDGASRRVTDGPFAATDELVAGFWIWKVADMAEALAWAQRCPNPMPGPSEIEIRRIYEMEDFGEAVTPELAEKEAAMRQRLERKPGLEKK